MKRNKLKDETSPYLLQHVSNPVDWFPWGEEAFEKARTEEKPIFLSIGYSACHWCHVMAHESFEDEEMAGLMNAAFVSVKVDREEMPHIDNIYMQACQLLTGSGGWPLTIIMTPGRQPFFAATYLPKHSRQGIMGLSELIPLISKLWQEKKDEVLSEASRVSRMIRQSVVLRPGEGLDPGLLQAAYSELKARFNAGSGGFGPAPKFPMPHHIMFLLRYFRRTGDREALDMAVRTLVSMRTGGIYDQAGFGFHRYSTDEQWLVPHFEKMLYDQALLAYAYTEAYQVTGRQDFKKTAEEIITYVLRDLRTPDGLFASAQDADSEGGEGRYYLWTVPEIKSVLSEADFAVAVEAFGLSEEGNFPEGKETGLNILHLMQDNTEPAGRTGLAVEEIGTRIELILEKLYQARLSRTAPSIDSKALIDWNGLMIAALAKAGASFARQDYIDAARASADFILKNMQGNGRLKHVFMAGSARFEAELDDYAFLIWGLVELYEASFESAYLAAAVKFNTVLIDHFRDIPSGGFLSTADDIEAPITQVKTAFDNAVPSGNSVAMLNLLKLAGLTGDIVFRDLAVETGKAFSGLAERIPSAFTFMMCALDLMAGPRHEVVIAGDPRCQDTREMTDAIQQGFFPSTVVRIKQEDLREDIPPFMQDMKPLEGRAAAYVCTDSACRAPTTDTATMLAYLG